MAVKILMPKGSDSMTEGKVLKWLKKEGDHAAAHRLDFHIDLVGLNLDDAFSS